MEFARGAPALSSNTLAALLARPTDDVEEIPELRLEIFRIGVAGRQRRPGIVPKE